MSDERCFEDVVSNTIERNDNAMFYQLSRVLNENKPDSFLNYLVCIDFKEAIIRDNKGILKPLFEGRDNDARKKGLIIKCKDGIERKFVPFDKSNSMSKESCIYFIDSTIKNADEKMYKSKSKYYSSSGLDRRRK